MKKLKKSGKTGSILLVLIITGLLIGGGAGFVISYFNNREPVVTAIPRKIYPETLIVAADQDYQPYSFYDQDGEASGYDVELIYRLSTLMHKNVEIRLMPWADAVETVKKGEADILLGLDYNMENLEDFELTMPLDNDPFVAFGRERISSIDDLYGKKIATLEQSGSFASFLTPFQLEEYVTVYPSYSEAFYSLLTGESDYVIAMYSVGRRAAANLDDDSIVAAGPTLAGNYLCIGTSKGNTQLVKELNESIVRLKKDGTMDSLGTRWLGRYVEETSFRDYAKKNLPAIVITLGLALILGAGIFIYVERRIAKSTSLQHEMTKRLLQYQKLITEATKGLYESIYEIDITHNCAGGESTKAYFESLGIDGDTCYYKALETIASKQIKEEYIGGYLDTFSPENVLSCFERGIDRLSYDFMITNDGARYYWMRIMARVFYWAEDDSVRMIVYRQNIDEEKTKERFLEEKTMEDSLTGLYNKAATHKSVQQVLDKAPLGCYAFFIVDIDDFKRVNDTYGHMFGDFVIKEFARALKKEAGAQVTGRIGGDEFAFFLPVHNKSDLKERASRLVRALSVEMKDGAYSYKTSVSIGAALYPEHGKSAALLYERADKALYAAKRAGKNGCAVFDPSM